MLVGLPTRCRPRAPPTHRERAKSNGSFSQCFPWGNAGTWAHEVFFWSELRAKFRPGDPLDSQAAVDRPLAERTRAGILSYLGRRCQDSAVILESFFARSDHDGSFDPWMNECEAQGVGGLLLRTTGVAREADPVWASLARVGTEKETCGICRSASHWPKHRCHNPLR